MIDVVGMGARGWPDIPTPLQSLIKRAEVVLGSPRHLKLVPAFAGQQREVWPSPLREGLTELLARFPDHVDHALTLTRSVSRPGGNLVPAAVDEGAGRRGCGIIEAATAAGRV